MAKKFQVQGNIQGSYIVEEHTLRRISTHLTNDETGQGPTVRATFKDGRILNVPDIEDVISSSITSAVEIESIDIRAPSLPNDSEAQVHISSDIYYAVASDKDKYLMLQEDIFNEFKAARAWYSIFTGYKFRVKSFSLMILWIYVIFSGSFWLGVKLYHSVSPEVSSNIPYYIFPSAIIFAIIIIILNALFPSICFKFGAGLRVHNRRSNLIYFISVMVIFGAAMSVGGNYISRILGI